MYTFSVNNFNGTIEELAELLEKHNLVGTSICAPTLLITQKDSDEVDLVKQVRNEMSRLPLRERFMLKAIKIYRGLTGSSLKEAKDWCEANLPEYNI
jgi:ribosomal protein L7/L12